MLLENFYVYIYLNNSYQKCALLTFDGFTYTLEYGKKYIALADSIPIDPINLPLYGRVFESPKIFGAIKDCSPDRWGRYLLEKKFNRELSEMEYVLANNIDHVGALAFSPEDYDRPMKLSLNGYEKHETDKIDLKLIMDQTELALSNENDEKLRELLEYGPSLGGARPKYTMYVKEQAYLAKFSVSQDKRREPLIEFACMKMAKDLKLNVPIISLTKVSGRDVYAIKRFDRDGNNKLPFVSALSICEWDENGHTDWSYPVFSELLIQIGTTKKNIDEDLKELFKRIAFNIAINNDDDHPRNHGVYFMGGEWRLSPLYDVVSKDISTQTFLLAMDIGTRRREASKVNLLSAIKYFRISLEEAEEIIETVFTFVENHWKEYFRNAGLNPNEIVRFENSMTRKD